LSTRRLALLLACCVCLLWQAVPAWAAIATSPVAGTWGTNGRVWSIVRAGNVAYLGGEFTQMIPSDPTKLPVAVSNLAAVNVYTGRLTTWAPKVDGPVYSLATNGTTLFVGGAFTTVDGQPRSSFAAVGRNGAVRPWSAFVHGRVRGIALEGTTLYLAGRFNSVADQPRNGLAELDLASLPPGALLPWAPSANRAVRSVAPLGDGSVVVAGVFTSVNGDGTQEHEAHVLADGSADAAWASHPARQAWSVAASAGEVVVGLGGEPGGRIEACDATGAPLWSQEADGDVQSVTFEGGEVVAAGHFGFIAGQNFPKLAALDLAGNLDTSWRPHPNSAKGVWTVAASADMLFAGGDFTMVGNAAFDRFAEFPVS
jgi:hypothetical protein